MYPITTQLKRDLREAGIDTDQLPYKAMIDAVQEYEHGSCDVEDAFRGGLLEKLLHQAPTTDEYEVQPALLEAYAAVVLDQALTIHNWSNV